jgi:hypothetical protein
MNNPGLHKCKNRSLLLHITSHLLRMSEPKKSTSNFSDIRLDPEIRLLIKLAKSQLLAHDIHEICLLLRNPIDWKSLVNTAVAHRVYPLVYQNIFRHLSDQVPPSLLPTLNTMMSNHIRRNLLLCNDLKHLLKIFFARGLRAIPYKGPILGLLYYKNLALRPFDDLDIIVHPRDISKVIKVLQENGYEQTRYSLGDRLEFLHHFYFIHPKNNYILEVHWRLAQKYLSFPFKTGDIWKNVRQQVFFNQPFYNFSETDLFMILCLHAAKHYWSRLIWICDLAEFINSNPLFISSELFEKATKLGIRRLIFMNLLLVHNLFNVELAEEILAEIFAEPFVHNNSQLLVQKFIFAPNIQSAQLDMNALFAQMRERRRDRIPFFIYHLLTPNAKDRSIRLPVRLDLLYYILRPFRLIWQLIKRPG